MRALIVPCLFSLLAAAGARAQSVLPAPAVQEMLRVPGGRAVLRHVRVIDGTGAPAIDNRDIFIAGGKITNIAASDTVRCNDCGTELDLHGRTVMPGIVGMHDHLFYIARPDPDGERHSEPPLLVPQMTFSAPRLYLAAGVTTLRTTGSVETYTDLNLRREIDALHLPGPRLDVTGPYLEGEGSPFIQMHNLHDAADARAFVDFWAAQGVTSFKAYMNITRAELGAAIAEAHSKGLKVTGHLCSVTYPEAIALGIDDLEHGFFVNTQNDPGKQPDLCPRTVGTPTLEGMDPDGADARALIKLLVDHHVAVTSTLPVFEGDGDGNPPLEQRVLDAMTPQAREAYLYNRNAQSTPLVDPATGVPQSPGGPAGTGPANRPNATPQPAPQAHQPYPNRRRREFVREMALERAFASAGGMLLAGPDPTGDGHVLPGFGDQRELELLVEAGFTPLEAIRIGTLNGAIYMGRDREIGSVAVGKAADLVVVRGDPSTRIADIENVEIVFKDGLGYDSGRLLESVRGRYGQY